MLGGFLRVCAQKRENVGTQMFWGVQSENQAQGDLNPNPGTGSDSLTTCV